MTHGQIREDGARRFDFPGDFFRECDRNGGDAGRLDSPLDQSHGLIAKTSGRGEQGNIDAVFLQLFSDIRSGFVDQRVEVPIQDVSHERKVAMIHLADFTELLEQPHPFERKNNVDVPDRIPVIIVVVGDGQIGRFGVGGDFTERRITLSVRHVEGRLVFQMKAAGSDQRQAALGRITRERSPGGFGITSNPGLLGPSAQHRGVPGEEPCHQLVLQLFHFNCIYPYPSSGHTRPMR
jgi:hypothetical protein